MFDELGDWDVLARRDGEVQLAGVFRQCHPEDAVALLIAVTRAKFDVRVTHWNEWNFVCVARNTERASRTLFFEVSPTGRPLGVADSFFGGFEQHAPDATA